MTYSYSWGWPLGEAELGELVHVLEDGGKGAGTLAFGFAEGPEPGGIDVRMAGEDELADAGAAGEGFEAGAEEFLSGADVAQVCGVVRLLRWRSILWRVSVSNSSNNIRSWVVRGEGLDDVPNDFGVPIKGLDGRVDGGEEGERKAVGLVDGGSCCRTR